MDTVTVSDWLREVANWAFLLIVTPTLFAAWMTVTSDNIVRAVLHLVVALAGTAAMFLMVGAAFVAWTVVLVYIGAVVILFLIGIMITRAPVGTDAELSHGRDARIPAALIAVVLFAVVSWAMIDAFGMAMIQPFEQTLTSDLANVLFSRFVVPFEIVSFVLLAALIGGITIARKDDAEKDSR